MTTFSGAKGRQVVSTSSADTVGKVNSYVVDPATHAVVAVQLKKTDDGDTLAWSDITAFGDDAVTVSGPDMITEPSEDVSSLLGKDHGLLGKRVLSSAGDELGKVDDVEFDTTSGVITQILVDGGKGEDSTVAGDRLRGVGSYAVVVSAEQA